MASDKLEFTEAIQCLKLYLQGTKYPVFMAHIRIFEGVR